MNKKCRSTVRGWGRIQVECRCSANSSLLSLSPELQVSRLYHKTGAGKDDSNLTMLHNDTHPNENNMLGIADSRTTPIKHPFKLGSRGHIQKRGFPARGIFCLVDRYRKISFHDSAVGPDTLEIFLDIKYYLKKRPCDLSQISPKSRSVMICRTMEGGMDCFSKPIPNIEGFFARQGFIK